MEKVILLGGFGFIGKNLIEILYSNYKVIVIDRYKDSNFINEYSNIGFYEYDFSKNNNIKDILISENPDYIINLISIVTAARNMTIFDDMIKVNLNIILKLYEASKDLKGLKFFLQFGSGEEYGNIEAPFKETDREFPSSPYALAKQITTNTAMMLNKNYNFPIAVVRPGNLFGKHQASDKFIPYIINKLYGNEKIQTTPGEQKRDFIYVPDFAKGINLALKNHKKLIGEIFNLSTGTSISLREIILFCKEFINSDSETDFGAIPYRENEIMNFELDISKFRELVNDNYDINIWDGLKKYIDLIGGKQK